MHQIRVHAAHLGFPLLGDKIYGADETCYLDFMEDGWSPDLQQRLGFPRHALHAEKMAVHTDEFQREWSAPLAEDIRAFF